MNIICFLNAGARGGYIWFFDKFNLIACLLSWYEDGNVGMYGENRFDRKPSLDEFFTEYKSKIPEFWNTESSYEDSFDELVSNIDFSTVNLSLSEIDLLESFFSNLYDDLTVYGSLEEIRLALDKDYALAEWSGFLNENGDLISIKELEEKLQEELWWT